MKNKVLAMLLALCMVMSLLPVAVFATDEETGNGTTATTPPAEEGEEDEGDEGDEGETGCKTCGCATCSACTEECGCTTSPCGAPGCTKTRCTNTLCEDYGKVVDTTHEHKIPCPVSGCESEKGHEGTHSGEGVVCSGDDQCGVSTEGENPEAVHQPGCPKLGDITLEGNKELAVYEWEFTPAPLGCACLEETHEHSGDEDACENKLAGKKMTLSINVVIGTSELAEDATDEAKQELINKAASTEAKTAAQTAAQTAWEAENEGWYCARCKAAVAEGCTLNADCTAAAHRDDCLSQCTMSSTCTNGAHKVQYVVKKDGTEVGIYDVRADAVAYFNQLRDAAAESEEECELYVGAIHCPKAGVPDGVVVSVNEAGEVVETPETPEIPEKPTKAEEFTDMEDWMAEGVQFALDNGLMEGLGNGRFDGRTKVDAITVATVFARMAGETITGASWKDDAAAWVEENAELFEGIDLEGAELARKDVVLVMWRQAGKPEPADDFELEFTDVEGLEGDHLTAMKWAAGQKIVQGNGDGTANPDGGVSRGELCILLSRAAGEK